MIKRIAAVLLSAGIALTLSLPAAAEEVGSIQVWLDPGDLAVTRGEVTLYRVGSPVPEGYQMGQGYGGGIVRAEDAYSPYLAQWLAQMVQEEGTKRLLDADGRAEFSRAVDGLYLLVQTERMEGFYSIRPTMVTVPDEGVHEVIVKPAMRPIVVEEPPATGDAFSGLLIAMVLILSGIGLAVCAEKLRGKD